MFARIRIHFQGVVIRPMNVQPLGHAHDHRGPIGAALIAGILRRGPHVGGGRALGIQRQQREFALGRHQHS